MRNVYELRKKKIRQDTIVKKILHNMAIAMLNYETDYSNEKK